MDFITQLWLPILVSAFGVWLFSAIAWMMVGHHKKDRDPLPDERAFMDAVVRMGIQPGNYGFPDFCQHDNLPRSERMDALRKLYDTRPQGLLRVWAPMNMGTAMLVTFAFYLVTSTVIAYLGWAALPHGTGPLAGVVTMSRSELFWKVFQVLGTAGILAYCFASFPNDLWFQTKRRAMAMNWIDGIAFGLITGLVFAWLWPK